MNKTTFLTVILPFAGAIFLVLVMAFGAYSVVKDPTLPNDITEVESWSSTDIASLMTFTLECYNKDLPTASKKFKETCDYLLDVWQQVREIESAMLTEAGNDAVKDIGLPE